LRLFDNTSIIHHHGNILQKVSLNKKQHVLLFGHLGKIEHMPLGRIKLLFVMGNSLVFRCGAGAVNVKLEGPSFRKTQWNSLQQQ
jgi:hypothetical protein